jgi:hypothetical protein
MAAVFCVKRPLGGVRRDDADRNEERKESKMKKERRFHYDEECECAERSERSRCKGDISDHPERSDVLKEGIHRVP